jgi:hypothetical protein
MKLFGQAKEFKVNHNNISSDRTTIGITKATQQRLNQNRAPGQCYDGFICQLIELWEQHQESKLGYIPNLTT